MSIPLFYVGFSMVWALMLASLTGETFAVVLGAAALICFAASYLFHRDKTVMTVMASVFFACFLFCLRTDYQVKPAEKYIDTIGEVSAVILRTEPWADSGANRYVIRVTEGEMKGMKLRLFSKYFEGSVRDEIHFTGKFFALDRKAKGIFLGCYPKGNVEVTGKSGLLSGFIEEKAETVRQYTENVLSENLPHECSSVLLGMLTGDKSELDEDVYAGFQKAGLAHLLAVSGFHTSLWSMLVYRSLLRRGLGVRTASAFSLVFVVAFAVVTGFSQSTVRAVIMTSLFFAGRMVKRQTDSKNSLGFAAILILLFNPFAGGDAGFLLSFFSTLGILTLYPFMQKKTRPVLKKYIKNYRVRQVSDSFLSVAMVSVAAMVFSMPVMVIFFDTVSFLSPLSNLLVTPFASLAIFLSGIAVPLSAIPVLSAFRHPLLIVSGLIVRYILFVTSVLTHLIIRCIMAT